MRARAPFVVVVGPRLSNTEVLPSLVRANSQVCLISAFFFSFFLVFSLTGKRPEKQPDNQALKGLMNERSGVGSPVVVISEYARFAPFRLRAARMRRSQHLHVAFLASVFVFFAPEETRGVVTGRSGKATLGERTTTTGASSDATAFAPPPSFPSTTSTSSVVDGTALPLFRINLDDPPRLRWEGVMRANKAAVRETMSDIFAKLPREVHAEVDKLVLDARGRLPSWVIEELTGVADVLDMSLADVVLVNLFFEITPFCTSIVAQSSESGGGKLLHARNLDFGFGVKRMSDDLRKIAIDVEFTRAGERVYVMTTFAGYVGAATGMRGGAFSITANEREMTGPVPVPNLLKSLLNLVNAIRTTDVIPVTWAIREVLEDETALTFEDAVGALSTRHMATQMYLTIAGVSFDEGVVLTLDRNKLLDTWRLNSTAGTWFLVQTNYDHWVREPAWDNRKKPAEKALRGVGSVAITPSSMYEDVLSLDPVLNQLTIYTTVVITADGAYESFVRECVTCAPIF